MSYLEKVIEKIENSNSEKEIKNILNTVDQLSSWNSTEKAIIRNYGNNAISFLK